MSPYLIPGMIFAMAVLVAIAMHVAIERERRP